MYVCIKIMFYIDIFINTYIYISHCSLTSPYTFPKFLGQILQKGLLIGIKVYYIVESHMDLWISIFFDDKTNVCTHKKHILNMFSYHPVMLYIIDTLKELTE